MVGDTFLAHIPLFSFSLSSTEDLTRTFFQLPVCLSMSPFFSPFLNCFSHTTPLSETVRKKTLCPHSFNSSAVTDMFVSNMCGFL